MNTEPQPPSADRPSIEKKPRKATADEIELRRLRVVQHRYRSGLKVTDIAALEGVHHSQIIRDLQWWKKRWKKERKDAGAYVDDMLARVDQIYDAAASERALLSGNKEQGIEAGSTFEKTRCMMVMLAATAMRLRILTESGRVAPDKGDDDKDASYNPSEIRRIAERVRQLGDGSHAGADDMIPPGEREFLEGVTVDGEVEDEDDED